MNYKQRNTSIVSNKASLITNSKQLVHLPGRPVCRYGVIFFTEFATILPIKDVSEFP
jgi:hypothetical protein